VSEGYGFPTRDESILLNVFILESTDTHFHLVGPDDLPRPQHKIVNFGVPETTQNQICSSVPPRSNCLIFSVCLDAFKSHNSSSIKWDKAH
jgi:hypothetical protein